MQKIPAKQRLFATIVVTTLAMVFAAQAGTMAWKLVSGAMLETHAANERQTSAQRRSESIPQERPPMEASAVEMEKHVAEVQQRQPSRSAEPTRTSWEPSGSDQSAGDPVLDPIGFVVEEHGDWFFVDPDDENVEILVGQEVPGEP